MAEVQKSLGDLKACKSTLKSVQPEIDLIGLTSNGPDLLILRNDRFTDLVPKPVYWNMRLTIE